MAEKIKFEVEGYECLRCSHRWQSQGNHVPRVCPKCKSYLFDVSKNKGRKANDSNN